MASITPKLADTLNVSDSYRDNMHTITLEDEWFETMELFGEPISIVKDALRSYSIEQCQRRIRRAAERLEEYQRIYQCGYAAFSESVQTDADFLRRIEAQRPTWEQDALEWHYWNEEYQTWQSRLDAISKR